MAAAIRDMRAVAAHLGLDAEPRAFMGQASDFVDHCVAQTEKQKTRMRT